MQRDVIPATAGIQGSEIQERYEWSVGIYEINSLIYFALVSPPSATMERGILLDSRRCGNDVPLRSLRPGRLNNHLLPGYSVFF
jgi:hypothetical protein